MFFAILEQYSHKPNVTGIAKPKFEVPLSSLSGMIAGHAALGLLFPHATLLSLNAAFGVGLVLRVRNLRRLPLSRFVVLSGATAIAGVVVLVVTLRQIGSSSGVQSALMSLIGGTVCVLLTAQSAVLAARAREGRPGAVALRDDLPAIVVSLFAEADGMLSSDVADDTSSTATPFESDSHAETDADDSGEQQAPLAASAERGVIAKLVGSGLGFLIFAWSMVFGGFVARASPPLPLVGGEPASTTTTTPTSTTSPASATTTTTTDPQNSGTTTTPLKSISISPVTVELPRHDDATWVCAGDPLGQLESVLASDGSVAASEVLATALRFGLDEVGCPAPRNPRIVDNFTIV